ncbi:hypothetical protein BC833DRAFT_623320 [Globomyces pollinis-pini]|nr:hypothetical protein BC833DRAFT_623320 [Globomyces pollinis-pini]
MDEQITPLSGERTMWVLEPQLRQPIEDNPVVLIRKPTAPNMTHRLLNPFLYRNIKKVGNLNDLAALLDTPIDWEERYNNVVADGYIVNMIQRFRELPDDTAESDIKSEFIGLVICISLYLGIPISPRSETKIIVGGILARYQYDVRSKTDPHFLDVGGKNLIACEAKTHRTFGLGEMWYHHSRGIQVLSALYAFNCPTFLFTQRQWKLFVENPERNSVLTFPFNDNAEHTPHVNSSLVQPMGRDFLKAIVICLLSQRVSLDDSMKSITLQESSQVKEIKPKFFDTPEKPVRTSGRLLGQPKPSYLSGYDDKGQPIYSLVRVAPPEMVARIEEEIALQEKNGFQKQASESTF